MAVDIDFKSMFEGKSMAEKCQLHTQILEKLAEASGIPHAVACVKWVHISQVQANDYNPNKVARA